MSEINKCATCKFFYKPMQALGSNQGMCRRYPPAMMAMVNTPAGQGQQWFFPIMQDDGWCGEFKMKIVEGMQ